jgi:apolipoprotein N-acyltransferase
MPWLGLGTTLTGFPELVGVAELVGARGVGFWIAAVNGLLAVVVIAVASPEGRERRHGIAGTAAAASVVLVLPALWGLWRAATLETWSAGRVAIVQPAVPQWVRLDEGLVRDSTFAALDRLVPLVEPGSVRLVLLPEMILPVEPGSSGAEAETARMRAYAREIGAPILFGARGREAGDDGAPHNSAFLIETDGLAPFRYDKHRLVPVVERGLYLPLGVPRRFRPVGDFAAGTSWPLADVEGVAFGATICFESAFPEVSRSLRRAGADLLVNLTNDAWFGAEPGEARSVALWQHPAHLVMRAIETRMGVMRAANTGFSFTVDPVGRVHDVVGPFSEGVVVAEVGTTDVTTAYVRFGDLTGNACGIGTLLLLLSAWRRRLDPSCAL